MEKGESCTFFTCWVNERGGSGCWLPILRGCVCGLPQQREGEGCLEKGDGERGDDGGDEGGRVWTEREEMTEGCE